MTSITWIKYVFFGQKIEEDPVGTSGEGKGEALVIEWKFLLILTTM